MTKNYMLVGGFLNEPAIPRDSSPAVAGLVPAAAASSSHQIQGHVIQ